MENVEIQRKDAVKFGSIIADVMKPKGESASVDVSSEHSRELKTVLDKVPPDSLKAVLDGCRDAQHFQQGKGFFRGKVTAVFDANDNWANGVQVMAVSDPGQQCITNQGACSIALQSELLAREIEVSVQKPGYVLVEATHNSEMVAPQSLAENGVKFRLRRWPRLTVQVTRNKKPVVGAMLQIIGSTPPADIWAAGCVDLPGRDSKEDCPTPASDRAGIIAFDTPVLPQSISVVVNGAPATEIPVVNGQAKVALRRP
jgi:hypothetical protein